MQNGRYVTCPETYVKENTRRFSVFLAGGITGCPDWQQQLKETPLFREYPVDFLNPRQPSFDVNNPNATQNQISWEHAHFKVADAVLFWFCAETVQPITLFELGVQLSGNKPLFIGVNPNYARKQDVILQTRLARPDVSVGIDGLAALTWQIENWYVSKLRATRRA